MIDAEKLLAEVTADLAARPRSHLVYTAQVAVVSDGFCSCGGCRALSLSSPGQTTVFRMNAQEAAYLAAKLVPAKPPRPCPVPSAN